MKYFAEDSIFKVHVRETMSVVYEEAPGNVTAQILLVYIVFLLRLANSSITLLFLSVILLLVKDDDISYCSPAICRSSGGDWDREVPDKIAIKDGKIISLIRMYTVSIQEKLKIVVRFVIR